MTYEIKRIPPGPALKVSFFVFLIVGFIAGLFYGFMIINLISSLGGLLNGEEEIFTDFMHMGLIGIIMMGIMMAIFSSVVMTAMVGIAVVTYNVIAGMLGGFKFELEEVEVMPSRYDTPPKRYDNPPQRIDPPRQEERDEY